MTVKKKVLLVFLAICFLGAVLRVLWISHVSFAAVGVSSVKNAGIAHGVTNTERVVYSKACAANQEIQITTSHPHQSIEAKEVLKNVDMPMVADVWAPSGRVADVFQSRGKPPRDEYRRRTEAVWRLGSDLTAEELNAVFQFILVTRPNELADSLSLNSIKNDLMDVLLRQSVLPLKLGRLLLDVVADPRQDEVLKDYCLQHFAAYYDRKWPANIQKSVDSERQEMLSTYRAALSNTTGSLAGTALIGMLSLSEKHSEIDRDEVGRHAQELAARVQYGVMTRVTAMQVCGRVGNSNILTIARIEAQSAASVQLRMASIATLGDLGDRADVELLASLSADAEDRVRLSSLSAQKRLLAQLGARDRE